MTKVNSKGASGRVAGGLGPLPAPKPSAPAKKKLQAAAGEAAPLKKAASDQVVADTRRRAVSGEGRAKARVEAMEEPIKRWEPSDSSHDPKVRHKGETEDMDPDLHVSREEIERQRAAELDKKIGELGPGDRLEMKSKTSASVNIRVASVEADGGGEVSIARNKNGKYTVSSSTEVNGGGSVGEGGAQVKSTTGGSVKREYEFDSPEEAREAAQVLNGEKKVTEARRRELLDDNLAAEEYRGKVAVSLSAKAKIPIPGVNVSQDVQGTQESYVRINYKKHNGKPRPDSVTVGNRLSGEVTGKGDLTIGPVTVHGGDASKRTVELQNETTVKIPEGVTPEQIRADPMGTLGRVVETAGETKVKASAKVTVENRKTPSGEGTYRSDVAEYEINLKTNDPADVKVTYAEKRGDVYGGSLDVGVASVGYEGQEIVVDQQD